MNCFDWLREKKMKYSLGTGWIGVRKTNLSTEFSDDDKAMTLWVDVKFDRFVELDVIIMLLFDWAEAKLILLLVSGTDAAAPAVTRFDVGVLCVDTLGGIWFKYSPLPIIKTVDCESPPSSLADESSRAYLPWLSMKPNWWTKMQFKDIIIEKKLVMA